MTYLLDTDTIVFLLRGSRAVADRITAVGEDLIATTMVNLAELYYGAFSSAHVEENLRSVDAFRRAARILDFDTAAAVLFGKLKAELKRSGNLLDDSDLFIASVALSADAVLVTNNLRHFNRIEGLALESWEQ